MSVTVEELSYSIHNEEPAHVYLSQLIQINRGYEIIYTLILRNLMKWVVQAFYNRQLIISCSSKKSCSWI